MPGRDRPRSSRTLGMGSRIVGAFATQLGARMETNRHPGGYTVSLTIPVPKSQ